MTNIIIKGNRYRLIDNKSFELPLPLKFVVLKEDAEIAEYDISSDEHISFRILTKYKENMITPISRPLTIADIYYFFSSRVFQDKTPFTGYELSRLGLEKYNVYSIIRKTRGITPYDNYWVRFEGDSCDFEHAKKNWDSLMSAESKQSSTAGSADAAHSPAPIPQAAPTAPAAEEKPSEIADINEILHQQKVDVAATIVEHAPKPEDEYSSTPKNSTMTADEIEQLLIKSGLAEAPAEPAPASSGGNLSPEEIAKLFAANDTSAEPAEVAPPAPASSGGNLSPEEIAKLFAANDTSAEPEPAEVAPPAPASSGGNLSPEEIAKLFAANDTSAEPAPAEVAPPAPASSGGNLSPEEIAKLFAANDTPAAPEPAEVASPAPASSGGNLSPEEIAKLFAANDTPAEPAPAEVAPPAPASSGGNLSPEEIAKLFAANDTPAEPEPASSGKMSQEDIERMLNEQVNAVSEPIDINAPKQEDNSENGDRLSPEEIEALLGGMKKDAQT